MVQCWYTRVCEELGLVRWKENTVLCLVLSEMSASCRPQLCLTKLGGTVRALCPALLFTCHRVQTHTGAGERYRDTCAHAADACPPIGLSRDLSISSGSTQTAEVASELLPC